MEVRDAIATVSLVLGFLSLGINGYLGFVVARMRNLEAELKSKVAEVVDLKLAGQRGVIDSELRNIREAMTDIREDLRNGSKRFAHNEKAQHDLEVNVLKALNELKDKVATRDDLDRLREEMRRDA